MNIQILEKENKNSNKNRFGKIVCLVPAYNEEGRIGSVLSALEKCGYFDRIVVIDDGSTDDTINEASGFKVEILKQRTNQGKSAALQAGFDAIEADIYVLFDADLIGLTNSHIKSMIEPMLKDKSLSMVTGQATGGKLRVDLAQRFFPILNGQRALRKEFVESLPNVENLGWGIETFMTEWAKSHNFKTKNVKLHGLSQVMKEEKMGHFKGISSRTKMYGDIIKTYRKVKKNLD